MAVKKIRVDALLIAEKVLLFAAVAVSEQIAFEKTRQLFMKKNISPDNERRKPSRSRHISF